MNTHTLAKLGDCMARAPTTKSKTRTKNWQYSIEFDQRAFSSTSFKLYNPLVCWRENALSAMRLFGELLSRITVIHPMKVAQGCAKVRAIPFSERSSSHSNCNVYFFHLYAHFHNSRYCRWFMTGETKTVSNSKCVNMYIRNESSIPKIHSQKLSMSRVR